MDEKCPNLDRAKNRKYLPYCMIFFQNHCTSKTYSFQFKKCEYLDCLRHNLLHGDSPFNVFPDPVTTKVVGVFHYLPGGDPQEKISR